MPFYNRGGAQPIANPTTVATPGGYETLEPLDVVSYGGLKGITVNVANGATTAILAAPATGFAYRLHSWGVQISAVAASGAAQIQDAVTALDATGHASTNGVAGFGRPLNGQLSEAQITVANFLGVALTFFVRYDVVIAPTIE